MLSLVIGTIFATWTSFLVSLWHKEIVAWPAVIVFFLVVLLSKPKIMKETKIFWLVITAWLLFLTRLFSQMMVEDSNGIWAGGSNVWGDWAGHAGYISNWLYGENFPPQNPWYAGTKLSYPFLFDFTSALLAKLGLSLPLSLEIPGIIFSLAIIILLYKLTEKLTKSPLAAFLSTTIFMFSGGLGFLYLLPSQNLLPFLTTQPKELTHIYEVNIQWVNFVISEMVPQRGILIGLGASLLTFTLWLKGYEKNNKNYFLLTGVLTGLLPFFHTHSFLAIGAISAILFLLKPQKLWFYFFIPASILALPQFTYFLPQVKSYESGFIRFQPGWLAHVQSDNWFWFWFKNISFMAILIPVALIKSWKNNRRLVFLYIPFLVIFILCNLFIFQPWENDNSKLLRFWYLGSSILVADFLARGAKLGIFQKTLVILLFVSVTFAGFFDAYSWLNFEKNKILMWSSQEIELAENVKSATPKNSIFLTTDSHNHWVVDLAGRKTVMGFRGWLWSWGINYQERELDVVKMFQGDPTTEELLKKYKIDFVIISPAEKTTFQANESYYLSRHSLLLEKHNQKIFAVNGN